MKVDIFRYVGSVASQGYIKLCKQIEKAQAAQSADYAMLMISTPGGDPNAGFRIARALQHSYKAGFEALVPRYCKSAGTMILLGATKLHMANQSELGPLDIQIKKGDELYGRSSGLDMTQAVGFLRGEALTSFTDYMDKLVRKGLSTKIAADISVRLVQGIFNPIAAQIEPLRLAEMQRATAITLSYGERLLDAGGNVLPGGLEQLVAGYPSHSFVIDRKEARTVFSKVVSPTGQLQALCYDFQKSHGAKVTDPNPTVDFLHVEIENTVGAQDGKDTNAVGPASPSARASESNRGEDSIEGHPGPARRRKQPRARGASPAAAEDFTRSD